MFTHEEIWRGIDRLAAHAQTSPSGLARRAGLDSTTFNPSKRFSADGTKPRWPSTESLAKALDAAHMSLDGFAALITGRRGRAIPALNLNDRNRKTAFDRAGFPVGETWQDVPVPDLNADSIYALQVEGDGMQPLYRDGDRLIIDQDATPRRGDRVIVRRQSGAIEAWALGDSSVQTVELIALDPNGAKQRVPLGDIQSISRIIWASQ